MSTFNTDKEDAKFDAYSMCDDLVDVEDVCHACLGSGEGQFDGTVCPVYKGK